MAVWKVLRTVYLVFLLLFTAAVFLWGYPIYRYLKNPVTTPEATPGAPAPGLGAAEEGSGLRKTLDPRSLLGVNAATIPKFEDMVQRVAPDSAEAWVGLGILYQYKGIFGEAERCYRKAIELNPDHPDAHYRLGTAYHAQDLLYDAITQYREAMRAKSGYLHAYYSLAAVYQAQGKFSDASWLYREILRMNPKEYQAHNNLGILHEEQGHFAEALKEYEKAVSIHPNDPVVKNNLEMARKELGTEVRSVSDVASSDAAPVQPAAPAPEPVTPPRAPFTPERVSTIFLKNKQLMKGQIASRDARGLWFEIDAGTKVYVSHDEIDRIEE